MVGSVPDVVTVCLQLVVVPRWRSDDDVRVSLRHLLRRAALVHVTGPVLVHVARRAVLGRSGGSVQKGWMRAGYRDHVGAHVMSDRLDVARHDGGIRD